MLRFPRTRADTRGMSFGAALALMISGATVSLYVAVAVSSIVRIRVFVLYVAIAMSGACATGHVAAWIVQSLLHARRARTRNSCSSVSAVQAWTFVDNRWRDFHCFVYLSRVSAHFRMSAAADESLSREILVDRSIRQRIRISPNLKTERPSRDPVSPGDPQDGNMRPAAGLPVGAAARRRMVTSLKRLGDLAIRGAFGTHPPNDVDNGRVEPGDAPCGRRPGLFPVLRAPGPPFRHAIPPARAVRGQVSWYNRTIRSRWPYRFREEPIPGATSRERDDMAYRTGGISTAHSDNKAAEVFFSSLLGAVPAPMAGNLFRMAFRAFRGPWRARIPGNKPRSMPGPAATRSDGERCLHFGGMEVTPTNARTSNATNSCRGQRRCCAVGAVKIT